ncbi:MAG: hypothetical protein U0M69_02560 [Lachnospiraceae bacterium]|nr:hypothetical protein [Lachnospiraceae bacterium]
MLKKNRKMLEFAGSMFLSAVLFLIIYKFIPIVYSTNDDRMIAELVSGQFTGTPESYGIQMTFCFTWFLSKLYEITRALNWYGIVLIAVQMFSFGAILYRIQSFSEKWPGKLVLMIMAIGAFVGIWLKVYVQLTYTTTAAFVGMAAIFWYATSETDWKNILMVGILANIAFCIRPNIFYMLIPATGLVYLWKLIGKKDLKKLTIGAPFMILAVTAVLFVINAAAYSKEGWKEFRDFFDVRTNVYDYYDLLPYEEYPELYEPYGISEEEFNMMRVYDYTVLGDLPKEFFPEYLEAVKELEKEQGITFVTKSVDAVKTFVKDVLGNAYGIENALLFVAAVILLILLIWKKNYPLAIYLAVQSAAMCVLWLYFTYWGRAIERIQMTMSLIFLAVILHVLFEMRDMHLYREEETGKISGNGMAALALGCGALILIAAGKFGHFRTDNIAKTYWYNDVQTIKEYCANDPDRLYYMDIATMTELYGKCTIKNTEPDYINYISLGDWTAYCPHYEEKLKNHGVENVAESITDDNTYVIMLHNYQLKCMKEYLNVEEEWVETIFGANETAYAVYQFH